MPDSFSRFDAAPLPRADNPWRDGAFLPDLDRLTALLSIVAAGKDNWGSQTYGALGKALDAYTAGEFRRAGYEPDAVWPRATEPRVLPFGLARALASLPRAVAGDATATRIRDTAGGQTSVVQGEFFPKQIDVLVADWDRGPELMVSTKSMTGSYSNNLNNRWEEFVGDVRNIRGRFPLCTMGVLFLADQSIVGDPQLARLLDMLRKLRLPSSAGNAYDATSLVIAEAIGPGEARLRFDEVPDDLDLSQFFASMLTATFTRLPVAERAGARRLFAAGQEPGIDAPEERRATR